MDRAQMLDILQHSSLDRETKLMIIDLLTLCDDQELEEEITQLVLKWDIADKAVVATLLHKFDELKEKHDDHVYKVEEEARKNSLELADTFSREQQIQKVRNYIETL